MLSHGTIFCSSKKKHTISLPSTEFKYRGEVNVVAQCVWLEGILGELGFAFDSSTIIWCDDQSEINICTDPIHRHRTKHIYSHALHQELGA